LRNYRDGGRVVFSCFVTRSLRLLLSNVVGYSTSGSSGDRYKLVVALNGIKQCGVQVCPNSGAACAIARSRCALRIDPNS